MYKIYLWYSYKYVWKYWTIQPRINVVFLMTTNHWMEWGIDKPGTSRQNLGSAVTRMSENIQVLSGFRNSKSITDLPPFRKLCWKVKFSCCRWSEKRSSKQWSQAWRHNSFSKPNLQTVFYTWSVIDTLLTNHFPSMLKSVICTIHEFCRKSLGGLSR